MNGILDLQNAVTYSLNDISRSWPKQDWLRLNGFTYTIFAEPQIVEERLRWLALQPSNVLYDQPYLQLAKVLDESGDETGGKIVREALEERKTRVKSMPRPIGAARRVVFGKTVGYFYDPLGAVWCEAGLTVLGWIIYRRSYLAGNILPTESVAFQDVVGNKGLPGNYPKFSPLMYSLENSLPLVKLGQADKWRPMDEPMPQRLSDETFAVSRFKFIRKIRQVLLWCGLMHPPRPNQAFTGPPHVRVFLWIQILLGWILATLFVAGISGLVHTSK